MILLILLLLTLDLPVKVHFGERSIDGVMSSEEVYHILSVDSLNLISSHQAT